MYALKIGLNDGVYMSEDNIINNLMIFVKANVANFLVKHSYFSNDFLNIIQSFIYSYVDRNNTNIELLNSFGKKFCVFVYGSLLKGEYDHKYFLKNPIYVGKGKINDYKFFDLVVYPGIKSEHNSGVLGEMYLVDFNQLSSLDRLEGNNNFITDEL